MNPLYILPASDYSGHIVDKTANFQPYIRDDEDIAESIDQNTTNNARIRYTQSVSEGNTKDSYEQIEILFDDPDAMAGAIIETVVSVIGRANMRLTNLVFNDVSPTMDILSAIVITTAMCNSKKSLEFFDFHILCNTYNKPLIWEDALDVVKGIYPLDELIKMLDLNSNMDKLSYTSKRQYWVFPLYIDLLLQVEQLNPKTILDVASSLVSTEHERYIARVFKKREIASKVLPK
jgi:hypothetical protein